MIKNFQEAVYAAYSANALASALAEMTGGNRMERRLRAESRLRAHRLIRAADPEDPEFLEKIQIAKRNLRTGGLGEFHNSPNRRARARVLLSVRALRADFRRLLALALALADGDIVAVKIATLTAPMPSQLAEEAIKILSADGWRNFNGAHTIDARFVYEDHNN